MSPELPIAISTLRTKRSRPVRLIDVLANNVRNCASSRRTRSARRGARNASRAASLASRPGCANLFHGQTARQSSQPKMRLPIARAQFAGNRPFVLDGEVGNAPPCVEPVRRGKAAVGQISRHARQLPQLSGSGAVSRQFERREDRAEKQPGAELARDQIGVLALPSKSGMGGKRLLHDRGSVDEYFHVSAGVGGKPAREVLEFRFDELVIVVALARRPRSPRDHVAFKIASGSSSGP